MTPNLAFAPPSAAGCFVIPRLDPQIPVQCGQDEQRRLFARFSQACVRAGIPLPEGDGFRDIQQVLGAQWTEFLRKRHGASLEALAGTPSISAQDRSLSFVIRAEQRLNVYQLRTVVEPLEAAAPGLGWYVERVITMAASHGHMLYDLQLLNELLSYCVYDMNEFTDEEFARSVMLEQGHDPLPRDKSVPAEVIDQLRSEYAYWPSDLIAAAGGHAHLVQRIHGGKAPPVMKRAQAEAWLRANEKHPQACVVATAIELGRALAKDKGREFVWFQSHTEDDDSHPLGAAAFIAWEHANLLCEAAEHWEQGEYENGMAEEAYARYVLPLEEATDQRLKRMAQAAINYFDRWALLGRLLSHFPIWEGPNVETYT